MSELYLFTFSRKFEEFRRAELDGICHVFGIDVEWICTGAGHSIWTCRLPSRDHARSIASRSVMVKHISLLLDTAERFEDLLVKIKEHRLTYGFLPAKTDSIRILCAGIGRKIKSNQERLSRIEAVMDVLIAEPEIKICLSKDASLTYLLTEDVVCDDGERTTSEFYLSLLICERQSNIANRFKLSERNFLSNTTMDPILSLIMANACAVKAGSLVCDPFVGSGSILLACSHFGGMSIGMDADYKLMHGLGSSSRHDRTDKHSDERLSVSFSQYDLDTRLIDAVLCDSVNSMPLSDRIQFDCIASDPPYGVRESFKSRDPSRSGRKLSEAFIKFVEFCAMNLVMGGRACYWIPSTSMLEMDNISARIPHHRCLTVEYVCARPLSGKTCRLLVCMKKTEQWVPGTERVTFESKDINDFRRNYFRKNHRRKQRRV